MSARTCTHKLSTSHQEFHTLLGLCPYRLSFVLTAPQHSKVPGNCRLVSQGSCFAFFFFSCFRLSCWQLRKRLKEIPACLVPTGTGNHHFSISFLVIKQSKTIHGIIRIFSFPMNFASFADIFSCSVLSGTRVSKGLKGSWEKGSAVTRGICDFTCPDHHIQRIVQG